MTERERFVPRRVADVGRQLASVPIADHEGVVDSGAWSSMCRLVSALYHYEFHSLEQRATEAWDRIGDDPAAAESITGDLTGLLDGANYTPVTTAELDDAMEHESLIRLRLDVDFDLYDELLIYRRGQRTETVERDRFLREPESFDITVDDDVVVHTRMKPAEWFEQHDIDPAERQITPGEIALKQFRNVPRADIETLLPATLVRFRSIDAAKIAVPAVVSAILVLATKLLPTLGLLFVLAAFYSGLRDEQPTLDQAALILLFGGLAALGAFVFRQWTKYKNRRIDYLKTLSENLYFRTVADGPGVFHILLSSAEEQQVTEVLIAYRLLLAAHAPLAAGELDAAAETWLSEACEADIDFEVDDALDKLDRLGIARPDHNGRWTPVGIVDALSHLDHRWDELFRFEADDDMTAPTADDADDAPTLLRPRRVVDRFRNRLGERLIDTA